MHSSLKNRLASGQDAGDLPEQMERRRKALAELHGSEPQVNTAGKIPESEICFQIGSWHLPLPAGDIRTFLKGKPVPTSSNFWRGVAPGKSSRLWLTTPTI